MAKHDAPPDAAKARKRRRRRRFLLRLLLVTVFAAAIVFAVNNGDALSPSNWLPRIGAFFSGGGEGFPVDVSGNQIYRMEETSGGTVLLSDTYVTVIGSGGDEVMRRAHAFSDPQLRTAGKYILVAEKGGKRLQLETRAKTVQTVQTDYDILTTALHKSGSMAVVTGAQQGYNAAVSVYSVSGKLIYHRLCSSLVADVAFSPDGKQLALITIGAENGTMRSGVEIVAVNSTQSEMLYAHSETDVLLCRVAYLSDGTVTAVGDTAVWMYRPKKDVCNIYPLTDGSLIGYAIGNDSVMTVVKPYGANAGASIAYICSDATAAFTATAEGTFRDIAVSGNSYALLSDSYLYNIGSKGIVGSRVMTADGRLTATDGSKMLVLGLKTLSKYTAPSRLNESD